MKEQERDNNFKIEYHADDFGLFPTQSRRILRCHTEGMLNGVSIFPNSRYLGECMEMLSPYENEIQVTVHLNLFEGQSVCQSEYIPLLTDLKGNLNCSFGKLLIHSFSPKRDSYRQQLKKELSGQLNIFRNYASIRIDGHAHYHMIPVVFDALMDVIQEEHLNVSYIRIPREYMSLYFGHMRRFKDVSLINFIKVLVLNLLAFRNTRKYRTYLRTLEQKIFMGVFLSGRMYRENLESVIPAAVRLAHKLHCGLEILAHPGGVYEELDILQLTNSDDVSFMTSQFRKREESLFIMN